MTAEERKEPEGLEEFNYEDVEIKKEFVEEEGSTNTSRQTQWSVFLLKEWMHERYPEDVLESLDKEILAERLKCFYQEIRRDQRTDYSCSAHFCIRAGINRYLTSEQIGKTFSVLHDPIFKAANKSLKAKLKRIQDGGQCKTQHHSPIQPEDIKKCYESGVFGDNSPTSLLRVNWFNITMFFRTSGRTTQRKLKKTSFVLKKDSNNIEYVEMAEEDKMKNHPGGLSNKANENDSRMFENGQRHCPVQYFKKFLASLNPDEEALFQRPKRNFSCTNKVWFDRAPLGVNTLSNIIKEISSAANLSQIYTNYSIRATSLTALHRAGVPLYYTLEVSGLPKQQQKWPNVAATISLKTALQTEHSSHQQQCSNLSMTTSTNTGLQPEHSSHQQQNVGKTTNITASTSTNTGLQQQPCSNLTTTTSTNTALQPKHSNQDQQYAGKTANITASTSTNTALQSQHSGQQQHCSNLIAITPRNINILPAEHSSQTQQNASKTANQVNRHQNTRLPMINPPSTLFEKSMVEFKNVKFENCTTNTAMQSEHSSQTQQNAEKTANQVDCHQNTINPATNPPPNFYETSLVEFKNVKFENCTFIFNYGTLKKSK